MIQFVWVLVEKVVEQLLVNILLIVEQKDVILRGKKYNTMSNMCSSYCYRIETILAQRQIN